jgi:hypothetical protein
MPRDESIDGVPQCGGNGCKHSDRPPWSTELTERAENRIRLLIEPRAVPEDDRIETGLRAKGAGLQRLKPKGRPTISSQQEVHPPIAEAAHAIEQNDRFWHWSLSRLA